MEVRILEKFNELLKNSAKVYCYLITEFK